ncbi:hypothetical protein M431DRAFT_422920 [Trichoderma harzianum CBS 226.95]|uniref:Uncharacterized protein n=1 Tax=Trichoderma harzianum CBS 226.95 TaxID=983964 RepID=A0A2T4ABV0_TRIHA|nr:hypothetical protein M431DRAFT_422920 [Trichoderma harzianum CBS 226.95]PTB54554.1 hypothetical protein M431DRAFT_422920 [Trichoderma harzianum CBS 226.95]
MKHRHQLPTAKRPAIGTVLTLSCFLRWCRLDTQKPYYSRGVLGLCDSSASYPLHSHTQSLPLLVLFSLLGSSTVFTVSLWLPGCLFSSRLIFRHL